MEIQITGLPGEGKTWLALLLANMFSTLYGTEVRLYDDDTPTVLMDKNQCLQTGELHGARVVPKELVISTLTPKMRLGQRWEPFVFIQRPKYLAGSGVPLQHDPSFFGKRGQPAPNDG